VEDSLRNPTRVVFDFEPAGTVVYLGGRIEGAALHQLACAMDAVLRNRGRRFIVDVSAVETWSLIAQAVILATARRKAAHGQQLVLRGASRSLREQSQQLGLFERIRSIDARDVSAWRAGSATGGAGAYAVRPSGARAIRQS
jgi:anti-anti-sigma regulatory factor